jgi:O-antigen/teichoic acid export membrane protein
MMGYSLPLTPTATAWWVINVSDRYVIKYFCGLSIVGIYSVANKIPTVLAIVSAIFVQAWQLSAIKEFESEDRSKFYSGVYEYYNIALVLISSILIIFNRFIASILFAKNFYNAWIYVPFLLVGFMFSGLAAFLTPIFSAAKKTSVLFLSTLISAIVNIIFNILFVGYITKIGADLKIAAIGSAIATAISFSLLWIIRFRKLKEYIKLDINLKKHTISYIIIIIQAILFMINFNSLICYSINLFLFVIIIIIHKNAITVLFQKSKELRLKLMKKCV